MSIHAPISAKAKEQLAAQRRSASIFSAAIAFLFVVIMALVLGLFLLPSFSKESATIVTYQAHQAEDDKPVQQKVKTSIQRKPSAPSSSMAKVIASTTTTAVSIPVPDVTMETQTVDFGDGDDFGSGWGDGIGAGAGGGASFFNQSVNAERIAYVIDFSLSMKGERERLMRLELSKSVEALKGGTKYQLIFFSGPAWVAGSGLPGYNYLSGKATVKGLGGHKYEWTGIGTFDWTPKGKRQPVEWLEASSGSLANSLEIIKESPLSGGTDWENPLLMAFDMEPAPQLIFFMTDGEVKGRDMMELTKSLAALANKKGIKVNTIALMEPKAEKPMADLAKRTGGQFTIVGKDGKARPGKDK